MGKHRRIDSSHRPKKIVKTSDTDSRIPCVANNDPHSCSPNVPNASDNSSPMEIPGFYYDSEKNRYFKILQNKTFGSGHPHSTSVVRERKMTKEIEKSWVNRAYNKFDYLLSKEVNPFKSHHRARNGEVFFDLISEEKEFILNLYHRVGSLETSYLAHRVTDFLA
ncbi:15402_t:CDS:2, partial [Acaulospora colombiana]